MCKQTVSGPLWYNLKVFIPVSPPSDLRHGTSKAADRCSERLWPSAGWVTLCVPCTPTPPVTRWATDEMREVVWEWDKAKCVRWNEPRSSWEHFTQWHSISDTLAGEYECHHRVWITEYVMRGRLRIKADTLSCCSLSPSGCIGPVFLLLSLASVMTEHLTQRGRGSRPYHGHILVKAQ